MADDMFERPAPHPHREKSFAVPPGACDSHAHVIGPHSRYALSGRKGVIPPESELADYIAMLDALRIDRGIMVQPSAYSTDNTITLDAVAAYPERLRAIAIPDMRVTGRSELSALRDKGVCGVRFNTRGSSPTSAGASPPIPLDDIQDAGPLLADAGLHAQFLVLLDRFPDFDVRIKDFPVDIVIDHMGYPEPEKGINGEGFKALLRLLETGRCWVKLSAPYRFTKSDLPYEDVIPLVHKLVEVAPERLLWATDWPHSAVFTPHRDPWRDMPNDGALVDLLGIWVPDETTRNRILVDNPARLYGFD